MTPEGIFAKGIKYKDRELTKEEKLFNCAGELRQISQLMSQIKKLTSYDKIEVFQEVDGNALEQPDKLSADETDQVIYQIAIGVSKMQQNYLKENMTKFIQQMLETTTYIERVIMVRKQMEVINNVLDIVNRYIIINNNLNFVVLLSKEINS